MIGQDVFETTCRVWKEKKSIRRGQIDINSELGAWIALLSSLSTIRTIVDIGTWSGSASTLCIASGVNRRDSISRDKVRVLGFEIDLKMTKIAARRLARFKFIQVVYGSIVEASALDKENLSSAEESWLIQDLQKLSYAPNVLELVPPQLDLVVLDGGEFSSHPEYLSPKGPDGRLDNPGRYFG